MTTETTITHDEAQIRQLITDMSSAICAKDIDRLMAHYDSDVVVFDAIPPFQTRGADAFRRAWEACFPCFPDSFQTEMRDLRISVDGDLALAHWIWRFTGMEKDHPAAQTWMRNTVEYQRQQGGWRIVHEHVSVPFDPYTGQVAFTVEP